MHIFYVDVPNNFVKDDEWTRGTEYSEIVSRKTGANEFIVEDVGAIHREEFLVGYNEYCKENNFIIEQTAEGISIQQFVSSYHINLIIGDSYYFTTFLWMPVANRFLSIKNFSEQHRLLKIEPTGQLLVEQVSDSKPRKFPEVTGPVTDKTQLSVVFESNKEQDDFLLMLKLRFSDWKLDERTQ